MSPAWHGVWHGVRRVGGGVTVAVDVGNVDERRDHIGRDGKVHVHQDLLELVARYGARLVLVHRAEGLADLGEARLHVVLDDPPRPPDLLVRPGWCNAAGEREALPWAFNGEASLANGAAWHRGRPPCLNQLSHGPRSSGVSGRAVAAASCTTAAADCGRRLRRMMRSASLLSLGYEIELWKDCHLMSFGSPVSVRDAV
eukprot:scaffold52932_cov48-Phaeocystis_antarctica.AAC.2